MLPSVMTSQAGDRDLQEQHARSLQGRTSLDRQTGPELSRKEATLSSRPKAALSLEDSGLTHPVSPGWGERRVGRPRIAFECQTGRG